MADQQDNPDNKNPGQKPAGDAGGDAPPDAASVAAELTKLREATAKADARIRELNVENEKYRKRNDDETKKAIEEKKAAEAKLKEQGEYQKLLDQKSKELDDVQKQVAALTPKADRFDVIEKRQRDALDAAKAKGDLPSFVVKSIDACVRAGDIDGAADVLSEYRASATGTPTAPPPKQPAPPAPASGAAPPSPPTGRKPIESMNEAELRAFETSDPAGWAAATGGGPRNGAEFNPVSWIESRSTKS